jgi:7,8-dihydroneopterin aldolase/epimerase/oxygenase
VIGDRVFIHDLRLRARIGVGERERARRQEVIVDVDAFLDVAPAGCTDDIEAALDYAALAAAIREHVVASRCHLVEALAEGIAATVLERPRVERVCVRVTKPAAVAGAGAVGVAIERDRRIRPG